MSNEGKIYIGTSNVVIPGNKTTFPAEFQSNTRLHYYSRIFNSVEINSSFYKIPLQSTYAKWSMDTSDQFRFSLKLSKEITHIKDLKADLSIIHHFMMMAAGVGNKKGCILIQFPGKIGLDYFTIVENILAAIKSADTGNEWKKAVEFRNDSWYTGETNELLDEYRAALVLHDHPKAKIFEPNKHAPFIYLRFHGPKGDYRESYTESFLQEKAGLIRDWKKQGKDVFVYFNNTIGDAFKNAITLQQFTTKSN